MARFSWWNWVSKRNDFASPSNMTKGEVWTIAYGLFSLFIFVIFTCSTSAIDYIMLSLLFVILLMSLSMYIRIAILPHKEEKLYVAGCTTLLATAWISIVCAYLHVLGIHWDGGYLIVIGTSMIVNCIIAFISAFKLEKQAKQEGKPSTIFPWFIHFGWFWMPIAALQWLI